MDNRSNDVLFDAGMKKAKQLIAGHIFDILTDCCDALVTKAPSLVNGFLNFTGNTITGFAAGLYMDGSLAYVVCSVDRQKPPVRVKVRKGEYVFLSPDYDGRSRGFKGSIETDGRYSWQSSMDFLNKYKSKSRNGFEIVVCNGTEYATYLENARNADVLTGLFQQAETILKQNIKPMK